jgi:hypothetical protein
MKSRDSDRKDCDGRPMGRDDLLSMRLFPDMRFLLFSGVDDSVSSRSTSDRPETSVEIVSCAARNGTTDEDTVEGAPYRSDLIGVDDHDLVGCVPSTAPVLSAAAAKF